MDIVYKIQEEKTKEVTLNNLKSFDVELFEFLSEQSEGNLFEETMIHFYCSVASMDFKNNSERGHFDLYYDVFDGARDNFTAVDEYVDLFYRFALYCERKKRPLIYMPESFFYNEYSHTTAQENFFEYAMRVVEYTKYAWDLQELHYMYEGEINNSPFENSW